MGLTEERPVVLITGVPAAGKSTVAERLARRFERGVHVKGDVSGGWWSRGAGR